MNDREADKLPVIQALFQLLGTEGVNKIPSC